MAGWLPAGAVHAANTLCPETTIPRPQALEKDVHFWVRVYTEVDTNSGFVHDQYDLNVVYDTLHFPADSSPRERQGIVDSAKNRVNAALRRLASAASDAELSPEDRKIAALWGPQATSRTFREAGENMRFQLGQSDRFEAGLRRSGAWEKHIEETLASVDKEEGGLPCELAVLPHVESSFNYAAYSKAGAAGMWQFMRSTGRRYMRIDSSVDERMDPYKSTIAAAQLLDYNYHLLGTWPLAVTAYNSGAGGMRRAKEELNTDDIVKIVREYHGPTFGFASRNYYVSFLAALEVDRNPEKYFPHIQKEPELRYQEVALPAYVQASSLQRILKVDSATLRELNPALLRSVWEGKRRIPRDFLLRLPLDGQRWTSELLAQRLKPSELYAGQPEPRRHRVQRGETLASVADEYGITAQQLARANRLRTSARLAAGRMLTVPVPLTPVTDVERTLVSDAAPARSPAASPAPAPGRGDSAARQVASTSGPGVTGIHVVEAGDSFSEIASKHGMSEADLLRINGLRNEDYIAQGQALIVNKEAPPTTAGAAASPPAAAPSPATRVAAVVPSPAAAAPLTGAVSSASAVSSAPAAETAASGANTVSGGAVPAEIAQRELAEDAAAVKNAENSQPVSAAQVEAITPSLGAADSPQQNPDPTDYDVHKDGTIRVAATESLGQYAEWLGETPAHLAQLNHLKSSGRAMTIGRKIRLDFRKVSEDLFEARRRYYHQNL